MLLTSGGHHYVTAPPHTEIQWWPPKHIRLASGRYASCWNVVLLVIDLSYDFGRNIPLLIADFKLGMPKTETERNTEKTIMKR